VTLSDFPGLTAAIVFTQGCNFRCPFCHNSSLLSIKAAGCQLLDAEKTIEALKNRKNIVEGLVITGGEPTLQANLPRFIKEARDIGYKIKLDTNGSCPDVIEKLISSDVLDYIAMDIKAPLDKYSLLAGVQVVTDNILDSIDIIAGAKVISEFRTTYVPELLTKKDLADIRSLVPPGSKYTLQQFIPERAWSCSLQKKESFKETKDTLH
jgi:pyruvate formate lyase activating enzyme